MNLAMWVQRNGQSAGDMPATAYGHKVVHSHAEMANRVSRIAGGLRNNLGMQEGDRLALLMKNCVEYMECIFGAWHGGLAAVPINAKLHPTEYKYIIENSGSKVCIATADLADEIRNSNIEGLERLIVIGDKDHAALLTANAIPMVETDANDLAWLFYTSGTTGRPKGVLFDHARAIQHATVACLEYEIGADTRYLIQIPHNSSVNITIVPCLTIGAAMAFRDSRNFDPIGFAREVEEEGVTHSFLVPTQLMRLLDRLPRDLDQQLGGLVTLGYGSSPISPNRLRELIDRFGSIFNQLYGMAEIASIGTILRKEDHLNGLNEHPELLASCGQPSYAVQVRVVNEAGDDVGIGERGEVIFAGPHVMKGYYRDPERTQEVLVDGWMHSGDIAEVSEDGFIFIVDRKKNLIIRGGLNIAPTEIENVLYRHDQILEATVIGVPDSEWGEAILAIVALKEGASVESDELRLHCRTSELTSIKIPERVEIWDSLPKNAVGKIAKNVIMEKFWGEGRQV